ncbi:MAG TPA: DinB family protein [Bryobacteraceae bacterium]|nr:DinB family protein [Bryobacteraceae bacterium]
MPVSADALRSHLDYTAWASHRLLDAAAKLSPEELTRDFKTADKCVLDTLVHVYAADRIWLARVRNEPRATFVDPEDRDLTLLQSEWPALLERWKLWLRDFTDTDTTRVIAFQDLKGRPYSQPAWQIVLHVVNHGTHHRGQVSGFLRSMGQTPPPLDLMAYYRTLA